MTSSRSETGGIARPDDGVPVTPVTRYARRVWLAALIVVVVVAAFLLVREVARVLLLVFGGILFAIFLHGTSVQLARLTRLPRAVTLPAVNFVLVLLGAALLAYGIPKIGSQVANLADEVRDAVQAIEERIEGVTWAEAIVRGAPDPDEILGNPDTAMDSARTLFGGVVRFFISVGIIVFVGIYAAVSPDLYRRGISRLVSPQARPRTLQLLGEVGHRMWWWIMGRLLSMTIIGVFTWLGLWFLDVPLAALFGVFAALLTFIPNIGAIIAVIPPMVVAAKDGLDKSLYVLIFYTSLQFVESYIITPLVQRRAIHLPPVLLLTAQAVLALLAGTIGVMFAAPLTAVGMLLMQRLYVDRIEQREHQQQAVITSPGSRSPAAESAPRPEPAPVQA